MLAKYYPSTGWFATNNGLADRLNEMFHKDDFNGVSFAYAEAEGITAAGGNFDEGAHELEYEG